MPRLSKIVPDNGGSMTTATAHYRKLQNGSASLAVVAVAPTCFARRCSPLTLAGRRALAHPPHDGRMDGLHGGSSETDAPGIVGHDHITGLSAPSVRPESSVTPIVSQNPHIVKGKGHV